MSTSKNIWNVTPDNAQDKAQQQHQQQQQQQQIQ
jgi:hypothetical protein